MKNFSRNSALFCASLPPAIGSNCTAGGLIVIAATIELTMSRAIGAFTRMVLSSYALGTLSSWRRNRSASVSRRPASRAWKSESSWLAMSWAYDAASGA